jgi:hypothetical protein
MMSALSRQSSPAPTYTSSRGWPLEDKSDSVSDTHAATKPDHLDPNHPHYIPAPPPPSPHSASRRLQRSWWTRKHIVIPYALALLFFLTTLWFISIALGVRFLNVLNEKGKPAVQEINVYVDGVGRGDFGTTTVSSLASSSIVMTGTSSSAASSTVASTTTILETASTSTGRLHLAQTEAPTVVKMRRETGFVTVVRKLSVM